MLEPPELKEKKKQAVGIRFLHLLCIEIHAS